MLWQIIFSPTLTIGWGLCWYQVGYIIINVVTAAEEWDYPQVPVVTPLMSVLTDELS